MRRREFIAGLGTAATWPLTPRAQQTALPVIGYLSAGIPELTAHLTTAFHKGLGEVGYLEGKNVIVQYRWARNDYARLPELAADLVARRINVIAAIGATAAALAAKSATTTVPIVFTTGSDPIQIGLVSSLNRPGGNVTGVGAMQAEIQTKRLGLLHELLPHVTRFAVLVNPKNQMTETLISTARVGATALGLSVEVLNASTEEEIGAAFATMTQRQVGALLVSPDTLFDNHQRQLVQWAATHAMPTIYPFREFAVAGGLASYGPSFPDIARLAGVYTGRILKGESPTVLPVLQPTKFDLVLNVKTAKALNISIPSKFLFTADEVIE